MRKNIVISKDDTQWTFFKPASSAYEGSLIMVTEDAYGGLSIDLVLPRNIADMLHMNKITDEQQKRLLLMIETK